MNAAIESMGRGFKVTYEDDAMESLLAHQYLDNVSDMIDFVAGLFGDKEEEERK